MNYTTVQRVRVYRRSIDPRIVEAVEVPLYARVYFTVSVHTLEIRHTWRQYTCTRVTLLSLRPNVDSWVPLVRVRECVCACVRDTYLPTATYSTSDWPREICIVGFSLKTKQFRSPPPSLAARVFNFVVTPPRPSWRTLINRTRLFSSFVFFVFATSVYYYINIRV